LFLTEIEIDALIAFLKALTDDRVAHEIAPFDHPSLIIPNGHASNADESEVEPGVCDGGVCEALDSFENVSSFIEIPAVGAGGVLDKLLPFDEHLGCVVED